MPTQLQRIQEGDWAGVLRNFDNLAQAVNPPVPQARVYNSANISITTATLTLLTFDSERFDNGSLHSTVATTGRMTAPITGLYEIGATVQFAANATGLRIVRLKLNNTTYIVRDERPAANGDPTAACVSTVWQFTAGDYVEVEVFQNSGGPLNVEASVAQSPEFWMVRLGGFVNAGV